MIFKLPKLIFYLTHDSLHVYRSDSKVSSTLELDTNAYNHLELVDGDLFSNSIGQFIQSLNLDHTEAALVLDESVLFEKAIDISLEQNLEMEATKFISQIPFDPEKLSLVTIFSKEAIFFVATNKQVYMTIIQVLESFTIKTSYVVPATLFGSISFLPELHAKDANLFLEMLSHSKVGNFLDLPHRTNQYALPQPQKPTSQLKLTRLIFNPFFWVIDILSVILICLIVLIFIKR